MQTYAAKPATVRAYRYDGPESRPADPDPLAHRPVAYELPEYPGVLWGRDRTGLHYLPGCGGLRVEAGDWLVDWKCGAGGGEWQAMPDGYFRERFVESSGSGFTHLSGNVIMAASASPPSMPTASVSQVGDGLNPKDSGVVVPNFGDPPMFMGRPVKMVDKVPGGLSGIVFGPLPSFADGTKEQVITADLAGVPSSYNYAAAVGAEEQYTGRPHVKEGVEVPLLNPKAAWVDRTTNTINTTFPPESPNAAPPE